MNLKPLTEIYIVCLCTKIYCPEGEAKSFLKDAEEAETLVPEPTKQADNVECSVPVHAGEQTVPVSITSTCLLIFYYFS